MYPLTSRALRRCRVPCAGALALLAAAAVAAPPPSVINEISNTFGSMMIQCVQLLYPGTSYVQEILDFWNLDTDIRGRLHLGCLAACSTFKLQLRDKDGTLNETNINSLLLRSGADAHGAATLLEVFRTCNRAFEAKAKACLAGLESMICFRSNMYRLNWTPAFYSGPYEYSLNAAVTRTRGPQLSEVECPDSRQHALRPMCCSHVAHIC